VETDRAPFAELNSDPRVNEFLPGPLSRAESDALVDRIEVHFAAYDFGLWAVEVPRVASFIGFIGLCNVRFEPSFTPAVEVGWRLAGDYWNRGYATEGARVAMRFGFEELGLSEIVSMTVPANVRSRRVMEKLGMSRSPEDDFDHPLLPAGHALRRHVLYRGRRPSA
jgi:RimJ/RimL family protein N-acetyltransferase